MVAAGGVAANSALLIPHASKAAISKIREEAKHFCSAAFIFAFNGAVTWLSLRLLELNER
jgi:hypothetical protein